MEELKICFSDHFGGAFDDSNIVMYESTWNDFGYHGMFEFHLRTDGKYHNHNIVLKETNWLNIVRIDGTMKKRHVLCNRYNSNISCLPSHEFISFPSKELCLTLLLNYPLKVREIIAKALCFNFGEDNKFRIFAKTNQYRVSILRCRTEEEFLKDIKVCKEILFCELPLNELLADKDFEIKHKKI